MQVGDIITAVDGTPIDANHRLADVVSQYQPGDRVKITVWRAGDSRRITVTLGENPQDSTRPYLGVRYADFADQPDDAEPTTERADNNERSRQTVCGGTFRVLHGTSYLLDPSHSTTPVRIAFFTSPMARVMSMSRGQASTQL